jgi:heme-degrading monooxygenase HmoA
MAIKRIWHGWTETHNAETYQALLRNEIFPHIEAMGIPGYRSIELLRRNHVEEVEFVTIMVFDSLDNVIAFQGEDYETAYVPEAAQEVLKRWDKKAAHYFVQEKHSY